MTYNYRITLKGAGDELTIAPYTSCRVTEGGLSGFDFPGMEARVYSNALDAGGYYSGGVIGARRLGISFEIRGGGGFADIRDRIIAMMNPENTLTIKVNLFGRVRTIEVRPGETPEFDLPQLGAPAICRLGFIAESPFFKGTRDITLKLPQTSPILSFPVSFMCGAGTICSVVTGRYSRRINNPGDVACGFKATMRAVHGDVTNPTLRLNDKFLTLEETVPQGDTIVFETNPATRRISVNGATRYNFNVNSTFFSLPPGYGELILSAGSGKENLDVSFEISPLYLGA